jgi:two-component system NarL family sensor kinase
MRRLPRGSRSLTRGISPIVVLTLASIVAMAVIGLVLMERMREVGYHEALREAEEHAHVSGVGVVSPAITEGVLRGDPAELQRLDRLVKTAILVGSVVRIKIWDRDGRIVYSDESRLIGKRYESEADRAAAFSSGSVTSNRLAAGAPENQFERDHEGLVEVYLPIPGPQGSTLLYESYERASPIAAGGARMWREMLPSLLAGLALLQLVNLALARLFASRLGRGDRQRAALLRRALDASDLERRSIAADLHDSVVQDLTAVSLTLAAASRNLAGDAEPRTLALLRDTAESTRRSVGELRTLLTEVYPPRLADGGLRSALDAFVSANGIGGLQTHVEVAPEFRAPPGAEALLYRAAQEGIRNAAAHSGADLVKVSAAADGDRVWLEVQDDGRGVDPDGGQSPGHLGLRVLGDLLDDAGGRLTVASAPGGGTVLRAEVPTP